MLRSLLTDQLQGAQPMGQIGTPRQQMQQTFVAQPQLVQSGTTTRLQMVTYCYYSLNIGS